MTCGFTEGRRNKMKRQQAIIMEYYEENRNRFHNIDTHIEVVCDHKAPDPNEKGFDYNNYKPVILSEVVDYVREAQFWDSIS